MRRIITFTILALTVLGGVALADRDHRGRSDRGRADRGGRVVHRDHGGRVVHRDHRWDRGGRVHRDHRWDRGGRVHRDHRWGGRIAAPGWHRPHYRTHRRPVYINNGYFQFHNGYRYAWARPVIHHRYYDYRIRPQIVVENYQPIAGYIWVRGQWSWTGNEWIWTNGHYEADQNYVDPNYVEPNVDPNYVDPNYSQQPPLDPNQQPPQDPNQGTYPQY